VLTNNFYFYIRNKSAASGHESRARCAPEKSAGLRAFLLEVKMDGIKSREGRWSVSLCNCSQDTVHFHYGNCVLHISLDDLRALGLALQSVADSVERLDAEVKKGSVH
jgi:hypothetical protein